MGSPITVETMIELVESELRGENDGVCLACGKLTEGGVEPDASEYPCEHCGEHKVVGWEIAMIDSGILA